ncbi:MAG: acyl carrier protein [Armatimonadota bacterium]
MDRNEIFEKVKKAVVEQLDVREEEITEESTFVQDLGADSLEVVEIVMALEEAFNIEIPDDEVDQIKTVGDAVNFIESKLKEKAGAE